MKYILILFVFYNSVQGQEINLLNILKSARYSELQDYLGAKSYYTGFNFTSFDSIGTKQIDNKIKISFINNEVVKISDVFNSDHIMYELFLLTKIDSIKIYGINFLDHNSQFKFFRYGFMIHDDLLKRNFYVSFPNFFDMNFNEIENSYYSIFELDINFCPLNVLIFKGNKLSSFSLMKKKGDSYFREIYFDKNTFNGTDLQVDNFTYERFIKYLDQGTFLKYEKDLEIEMPYSITQFGICRQ